MIERGAQIKTHKMIPGPNINPHNIPCRISEAKYSENYAVTNLQIVLNTPKNPYLNESTQRILAKFSYPNKSRNRELQTQKHPWIIPVT